jgi:hypothetical protein
MKTCTLILLVFSVIIVPLNLPQNTPMQTYQQSFYVRPPGAQYGTGNGSDWANAFSDLPENLERGAKYYVASGIYSPGTSTVYHVFDDAESNDLYIGIFKATEEDHGTDIGWQDTFGEGAAELGSIHFITGYYEIDGQIGTQTQGHGFKINITNCADQQKAIYFPWNSEASHIALKHMDIGLCGSTTFTAPQDAIYSVYDVNNIIITNCYIHDVNRTFIMMVSWSDVLLENNYFTRSGNQQESHSLGIRNAANITIRNNVFEDAKNSFVNLREISDVHIYGNIFKRSPTGEGSIYALIDNYDTATNVLIYNNTIYNLQGLNVGVRIVGTLQNVQVYNNLWTHSRANQIQLTGTHDYTALYDNWRVDENGDSLYSLDQRMLDEGVEAHLQVLPANPFVAPESGDFRLAFATDPGLPLPYPFNHDPDARVRGADGIWDRGAFEFAPALQLTGLPADQAINLTWTVNASLPMTATWQIDYASTPTNTLTVTDPFSTTRSYTLTELSNGELYTVTLNATVGSTSFLSDSVQVMPTDILIYLPIISGN